jgi:hypothetical protein
MYLRKMRKYGRDIIALLVSCCCDKGNERSGIIK